MTWFKVDDKLHDHAKAYRAGKAAMGVWVLAGSWASDNLSDGFVPRRVLSRWGTSSDAKRLVEAGLWEKAQVDGEDGWRFHNWGERNPLRTDVEKGRQAARERMANKRSRSQDVRANSERTNDEVHGTFAEVLDPDPTRPEPEGSKEPLGAPQAARSKRGSRIPDDWRPTEADVDWQRSKAISDLVARREVEKFVNYWRAKTGASATKRDWSLTWHNWLLRSVEQSRPQGRMQPWTPTPGSPLSYVEM